MGRWKAVLPFVLALAIAFLASVFLYRWIRQQHTPQAVAEVPKAEVAPVVVAVEDLAWGTKLKPEMLRTLLFLKGSVPPGAFSDPSAIEGRVTICPLKQNEAVTECRLAPLAVTAGGISAVVAPGKRAVAVKGDKVIGIAGFINPGNRVDVLVSLTDPRTKKDVTKIVLENILVLATGTQIEDNGEGKPAPVDVYTLEVTPEEGEKLGLAATQGILQFALKNTTDTEVVLTPGATIDQALASYSAKPPKAAAKKDRSPAFYSVEVIKGGKLTRQNIPIGGGGGK